MGEIRNVQTCTQKKGENMQKKRRKNEIAFKKWLCISCLCHLCSTSYTQHIAFISCVHMNTKVLFNSAFPS